MRIDNTTRSAMCDAAVDRIDVGSGTAVLQIRTGTPPGSITDTPTGTLLVSFNLPAPAFGPAASGIATANAISSAVAVASGTVGHYRVANRNGDAVMDSASVGTSSAELVLNTLSISSGVTVSVSSWTVTQPAS